MKNNVIKILPLALTAALMVTGCRNNKKPEPQPEPPAPEPTWSEEIQEEMELYMGTTLPYLELNEETMYHGYDDSSEDYGFGCYVIGDDNEENLIEDYGDLLVDEGWTFVQDDEGDYYTLEVNDFELTCEFDYYEATDQYAAGNEIAVYCPIYVPPVTEEALLAAGYTKAQGWPTAKVATTVTDAYTISPINAQGEWYSTEVTLVNGTYGDYYYLGLATHADVSEDAVTSLEADGFFFDESYDSYFTSDYGVQLILSVNNGFTLIDIYGPYLLPDVATEEEKQDGSIDVTFTFAAALENQTAYEGFRGYCSG